VVEPAAVDEAEEVVLRADGRVHRRGVDAEAEDAAAGGAGVGAVGRLREGGRGGEDEREEGVTEGSHGSAGRGGRAKNLAPYGASPHRGTRSRIFLDPPESPR